MLNFRMKCESCHKEFSDILKHVRKSESCQTVYNMEELTCERKMIRIQKKREQQKFAYENSKSEILAKNKRYKEEHKEKIKGKNKKYKEEHKEEIIGKNKKYHEENKSEISKRKATSYQKNRGFICQRKRFENHLQETNTRSYVTEQQQHLYYHTENFCQPDTMEYLNHSIEFVIHVEKLQL